MKLSNKTLFIARFHSSFLIFGKQKAALLVYYNLSTICLIYLAVYETSEINFTAMDEVHLYIVAYLKISRESITARRLKDFTLRYPMCLVLTSYQVVSTKPTWRYIILHINSSVSWPSISPLWRLPKRYTSCMWCYVWNIHICSIYRTLGWINDYSYVSRR